MYLTEGYSTMLKTTTSVPLSKNHLNGLPAMVSWRLICITAIGNAWTPIGIGNYLMKNGKLEMHRGSSGR